MTGGADPAGAPRVRIVHLSGPALAALAAGDLDGARRAAGLPLTACFVSAPWRRTWRRRSLQVDVDPASAAWVTGVVWDDDRALAVGRAGFHGPPDAGGRVEVGYAIDPAHRRQGYGRAALGALLDRAAREPGVRVVRASVRPDNVASRRLVEQYGFVPVGVQEDVEDGLETDYELPADRITSRPGPVTPPAR